MLPGGTADPAPPVDERHVVPKELAPIYHRTHGFCWCQPIVEDVPPNGRIYIHRQTVDSRHIEPRLT